jgi:oxygen-independent coproporphyrinogen-3 oxidase
MPTYSGDGWERWPRPIDARVARWKAQTDHLPSGGNQIYIHVPFCPFYCHFCPLYKTRDSRHRTAQVKQRFVTDLLAEIDRYAALDRLRGTVFRTIYFGGGTATQLTPDQLGRIVRRIRASFRVADDAEVTLEGTATEMLAPGYLEACVECGFTRVSFGVQSLDRHLRQQIGRGEDPDQYPRLIEHVRARLGAAFPVNADLMIGLPGQDLDSHDRDLSAFLEWRIDSLDVYSYWMVPGTRLFENVHAGRRPAPRYGDALLALRSHGKQRLLAHGFRQVSGEAYVRTDSNVFMQTTFGGGGNALNTALGLGPSAIGFVDGTLYQNVPDLEAYFSSIEGGRVPVVRAEHLDVAAARRRAILFGLQRLQVPVPLLRQHELQLFRRWTTDGLAELRDEVFHLTSRGALWYNQMQMALLPLAEQARLLGLLGTSRQQARAFEQPTIDQTELTGQLRAFISGGDGMLGSARLLGYQGLLRIKSLPLVRDQALGFVGPVNSAAHEEAV